MTNHVYDVYDHHAISFSHLNVILCEATLLFSVLCCMKVKRALYIQEQDMQSVEGGVDDDQERVKYVRILMQLFFSDHPYT
jgi:hypothetical protein